MHTIEAGCWSLTFNADFSGKADLAAKDEAGTSHAVRLIFPAELLGKLVARERNSIVEQIAEWLREPPHDGLGGPAERELADALEKALAVGEPPFDTQAK